MQAIVAGEPADALENVDVILAHQEAHPFNQAVGDLAAAFEGRFVIQT